MEVELHTNEKFLHEIFRYTRSKTFRTLKQKIKHTRSAPKKVFYGKVQFNIDPDVQIYINDTFLPGPFDGPRTFKVGAYKLKMIKPNFPPIKGSVEVKEGETTVINANTNKAVK